MLFTKPHWGCVPEADGECTVIIALGNDIARVSTKGRPSFQTVEDSVYTIVECYRDYFYASTEEAPE
jgi:hypothetical protein